MAIVIHTYVEPDFNNMEGIIPYDGADCELCRFAERTKLLDGGEGIDCPVRLFDIQKLRCFVPGEEYYKVHANEHTDDIH